MRRQCDVSRGPSSHANSRSNIERHFVVASREDRLCYQFEFGASMQEASLLALSASWETASLQCVPHIL